MMAAFGSLQVTSEPARVAISDMRRAEAWCMGSGWDAGKELANVLQEFHCSCDPPERDMCRLIFKKQELVQRHLYIGENGKETLLLHDGDQIMAYLAGRYKYGNVLGSCTLQTVKTLWSVNIYRNELEWQQRTSDYPF